MKSKLEKLAYKLCSTEVKMLIDKIEEHPRVVSLLREPFPSHSYSAIVSDGAYSFRDRVALALAVRRIRVETTKARIVEMIFEGQKEQEQVRYVGGPYVPGETLTTRKVTEQALKILEEGMKKYPTQTAEDLRQRGLL
jgi:hypothetical protein